MDSVESMAFAQSVDGQLAIISANLARAELAGSALEEAAVTDSSLRSANHLRPRAPCASVIFESTALTSALFIRSENL